MELERELLDELVEAGLMPVDEPWWLDPAPAFDITITPIYAPARQLKVGWSCEELPALTIANTLAVRPVFSESFIYSPVELKPYETPISDILQANSVKEMQEQEDRRFMEELLTLYQKPKDADT